LRIVLPIVEAGPAVETTELTKAYGRVRALDGLTMTVARGEVFGLLGPNGAGKTTVVKLLLGLARATDGSGRVLVRYSGTEPLLRIMIEGEHDSLIREEADRLARIVTAHLG